MLAPDDLWQAIAPLLCKEPPKPQAGRQRVPDRAALDGIIVALRTGCPWRLLPKALGCGSGSTGWRRLLHLARALVCLRFLDSRSA